MIFPFLRGFPSFDKAPFTWMFLILNVLIYFICSDVRVNESAMRKVSKEAYVVFTGELYRQYQTQVRKPSNLNAWYNLKTEQSSYVLGGMALRDFEFLQQADRFQFVGDPVAVVEWKKDIHDFIDYMQERPITIFGLSSFQSSWRNWITYQFMHGSFVHLFSNMIILLLFGFVIEAAFGGLILSGLYLLSGLMGALFFVKFSGFSGAPMIGASGAISGLIAFYAVFELRKRVQFVYFLSPIKGYYGYTYLPTWVILPICFATDIGAFLTTPIELGGVAYGAHIGGAILGASLGFFGRRKAAAESVLGHSSRLHKLL